MKWVRFDDWGVFAFTRWNPRHSDGTVMGPRNQRIITLNVTTVLGDWFRDQYIESCNLKIV